MTKVSHGRLYWHNTNAVTVTKSFHKLAWTKSSYDHHFNNVTLVTAFNLLSVHYISEDSGLVIVCL